MIIGQATGATVITKAFWDRLAPDQQAIVLDESKKMEARVLKRLRDDNVAALAKMQSLGLTVVPTPDSVQKTFEKAAMDVRPKLDGRLYSKEFRAKVEALIAQKRGGK
jgi:TRAP-type C4-dicarboxylate transport system substrate-binding protein